MSAPTTVPAVTGTPLAVHIGEVISDVRLGPDLPAETVAAIRQVLLVRKVVFFRGQDPLDLDGQIGFARPLGSLTAAHPTVSALHESEHALAIDSEAGRADSWHTDVTFVEQPPALSALRAVTLPPTGGDTLWANTASANARPPAERGAREDEHRAQFVAEVYETEHPVVRVHPETGEQALLLGNFARSFVGLQPAESRRCTICCGAGSPPRSTRCAGPGSTATWRCGQPRHPALRRQRLRPGGPSTAPGDRRRRRPGRPGRHAQPCALVGDATRFNAPDITS